MKRIVIVLCSVLMLVPGVTLTRGGGGGHGGGGHGHGGGGHHGGGHHGGGHGNWGHGGYGYGGGWGYGAAGLGVGLAAGTALGAATSDGYYADDSGPEVEYVNDDSNSYEDND